MNDQLNFWEEPEYGLARHTDPQTAKDAAQSVRVTHIELIVAAAIRRAGSHGLIAAELPEATGLALNTVTPRTRPLCMKGIIFDSGERRPAPSGRMQIVWKHHGKGTNA